MIYEHHEESLRENLQGTPIFEIKSIDDNYTQIFKMYKVRTSSTQFAEGASIPLDFELPNGHSLSHSFYL